MVLHLKDYSDKMIMDCLAKKESFQKYLCFMVQAIKALKSSDLRYNTKTGRTYNNQMGMIAWFSNSKDIPTDYTIEDHIEWSIGGDIMNAASRLSRGFKAI